MTVIFSLRFQHAAAASHIIVSATLKSINQSHLDSGVYQIMYVRCCFHDYLYSGYVHINPNQTAGSSVDIALRACIPSASNNKTSPNFQKPNILTLLIGLMEGTFLSRFHLVFRGYHTTFGGGKSRRKLEMQGVVKLEAGIR